eukprot:TRINITY_DN21366_c0_g1_i1.p1 TRINITY_DN21366_c0_g1~~TRINITY_DN21366_c0_g1_i1.p1  ORF type:complete len:495 (+),score=195.60 TRINITY_DN21366_c0_g1_i1:84-1568(+)
MGDGDSKVSAAVELVELVTKKGGSMHPNTAIATSPTPGLGTGVVATGKVEKGEWLAIVPQTAAIKMETILADGEIGRAIKASQVNEVVGIHVYIAYQKALGEKARYAGYVASLPNAPKIPVGFAEQEIRYLGQSSAFDRLGWALEELHGEFQQLKRCAGLAPMMKLVTFDLYRWAVRVCLSRFFYIDGAACLLPIGDVYNHDQRKGGVFVSDGSNYVLHSAADYQPGDEVFVTYGGGGPQAYFFHYGFTNPPYHMAQKLLKQPTWCPNETSPPWWVQCILTPDNAAAAELINYKEDIHVLMQDVMPVPDVQWDIEVPPEFGCDVCVDTEGCIKLFNALVDIGDVEIDVRRYALHYGARQGTIMLDPPSLAALRLLFTIADEKRAWYRAVQGRPVGPRSEVCAAAALVSALKNRLAALAHAISDVVKQLNVAPAEDGSWAVCGPRPSNYFILHEIGAVLSHETVMTQRLLEEASLAPLRYMRVSTGKPRANGGWR